MADGSYPSSWVAQGDPIALASLKVQERLEDEKRHWENTWREIALRLAPYEERFFYGSGFGAGKTIAEAQATSGIRHDQYQFDSSPASALEKYAAALTYYSTPSGQKWHGLKPADPALGKSRNVKRFCQEWTDLLFEYRYSGSSTFEAQVHSCMMSNGLYGHGYMLIEDRLADGIGYMTIHMSEAYPIIDAFGLFVGFHRKYTLTAEQALGKWGREKLPEMITKCLEDVSGQRKTFTFLHVVRKNNSPVKGAGNYKGMKWVTYDICIEAKATIDQGGYKSWPYAVTRHITLPGQTYSPSPAYIAFADIKSINEMTKGNLLYAQLTLNPPLMLADVDSLVPFSIRPASTNYGYLNEDGKPSAVPLQLGGDPRFAIDVMQRVDQSVKSNFYNTVFDILVQMPEMTATQALIRSQEKGALLGPVVGRQRPEFLNVIVTRELQIMRDAGAGPEPPEELMASGGGVKLVYDNPLIRAQKSEEGAGILRAFDAAQAMAAHDRTAMMKIKLPEAVERLADIYNCPADLIRSAEEFQEQVQAEQEQMQMAQEAQMAESASKSMLQLANAGRATRTNQREAA